MSDAELLAAYPTIPDAVYWMERAMFVPGGGGHAIQVAVTKLGKSLAEVVETLRAVISEVPCDPEVASPELLARAHSQMAAPEFGRYLAGRLGMV